MEMTYAQRGMACLVVVGPILLIIFGLAWMVKAGCPSPAMRGNPHPRPLDPDDPLDDPGSPFC
jgi:hypothetical protein